MPSTTFCRPFLAKLPLAPTAALLDLLSNCSVDDAPLSHPLTTSLFHTTVSGSSVLSLHFGSPTGRSPCPLKMTFSSPYRPRWWQPLWLLLSPLLLASFDLPRASVGVLGRNSGMAPVPATLMAPQLHMRVRRLIAPLGQLSPPSRELRASPHSLYDRIPLIRSSVLEAFPGDAHNVVAHTALTAINTRNTTLCLPPIPSKLSVRQLVGYLVALGLSLMCWTTLRSPRPRLMLSARNPAPLPFHSILLVTLPAPPPPGNLPHPVLLPISDPIPSYSTPIFGTCRHRST